MYTYRFMVVHELLIPRVLSNSLEVVSRNCDTQLQVTENVCDLFNLSPSIYYIGVFK